MVQYGAVKCSKVATKKPADEGGVLLDYLVKASESASDFSFVESTRLISDLLFYTI
jgi:hypothetical protein